MLLPPSPVGQPPGNTFWNDWYEKLRTIVNGSSSEISNLQTQINALNVPEYLVSSTSAVLTNERLLSNGSNTVVDFTTPGQAKVNIITLDFGIITFTTTNGSGALTATLTNSPKAGNPTKWIAFNDGGTTRYIPAW